jgi:hypothetical protein
MYFSVLKWTWETHILGYNFIPHHGSKDPLVNGLQLHLHLNCFHPEHIEIKLPSDGLKEVEYTRFNFVNGLYLLLNHPDLTGSLDIRVIHLINIYLPMETWTHKFWHVVSEGLSNMCEISQ